MNDRYARGEEWWRIVNTIWSGGAPRDFDGRFFTLRALEDRRRRSASRSPMMNAGASPAGRTFADPQLGSAFRLLPHAAGQRRTHLRDQAAA